MKSVTLMISLLKKCHLEFSLSKTWHQKPFLHHFLYLYTSVLKPRHSLQQKSGRDATLFEGQVDYAEDVPGGIMFEGGKEATKGWSGYDGGGTETERFVEDMKGMWRRRHSRPFLFESVNRER